MVQYTKDANTYKNQWIGKKALYNWILQHPKAVKYPITNDCLKVSIDSHDETQLVPKLLLQVSVGEIHNSMVSPPEEGGLKEARCAENNIIISDYTLCNILPTQLNNKSARFKFMCCCECCITSKSMN